MNLTTRLLRYAGLGAAATLTAALAHIGPAGAAAYSGQSSHIVDRTLVIAGTNGADDVVLSFPADGSAAVVDFSDGYPDGGFDRKQFDSVAVFLGNGDDRFRVASGAPQTDSPITVDGGNGADSLFGGNAKDVLHGGRGDDVVNGKVGADTEFLGSGDDTALWVPGEGSDVVHGDQGADTLGFDGGAGIDTMTLNASGEQSVFLREPGTIRMDLDSVEALLLKPLGGADRLTINGTDVPESVDVRADAGVVEVGGLLPRTSVLGAEKADVLQLNTLGGRDHVEVEPDVLDLITTSIDLGAGQ